MARISSDIRRTFPRTDEVVVSYIAGLVDDEDEEVEDIMDMTKGMLGGGPSSEDNGKAIDDFMNRLLEYLESQSTKRVRKSTTATKLDKTIHMRSQAMSATIAMSGKVDLESNTKGQASRVDLNKLAKAEAKLKAKIEKRAKKDNLYQGSKLIDMQRKQQSYEEMFMQVNPLDLSGAAKGKSKDIHLLNIDVSFGSNRILSGATLSMAHGRRYGLIGRNGIGKSTLLRHLALREVPIPTHISVLYVEQEIVGDETTALESVLQADVWRHKYVTEERELNLKLEELEKASAKEGLLGEEKTQIDRDREDVSSRLGEVQKTLIDMEAETGPARAGSLLAGLGFSEEDQKKVTSSFSGGWRMRLALARALFVKPDLLMLDEPSNMLDLNAIAWLEEYLQTWPSTLLVVSHDRAFLDAVATDIIHQHNQRLDYYKGNFSQFYATKTERAKNQRKEYETQLQYRQHLQAYIDRWRYNAARAAQAQSKIKILEKLPELEPPEDDDSENFKFPDPEKISPPLLQLDEATFGYTSDKIILRNVNIDVQLDSRIAVIGPNGAGKSTMIKLLTGAIQPITGRATHNSRCRIAYFTQHFVNQLDMTVSPVAFLQAKFPGKTEQEYRSHLGSFGITGLTGMQKIDTLSGGQKARVAFAVLSMQKPHILLLDEPSNHLDIEGIDALIEAIKNFKGGVISISHDERFITNTSNQLWVCADGKVTKFMGDVEEYKKIVTQELQAKLRP
ncbi:ATP-binding cassette subfamily F member 3 [Cryptococcus deuterogattii R265]|uniref:ATP-binding cassette subfamily F member 3 n=1 Tax=Cryptococcus deuterogattii (strain R265) TaxID=294750 RepID=UPI0005B59FD1|nr:ATP-binding cassette, subfamily F, member 3 [Cryptococcus deuterogattii CA1014]KIS01797.1 ATP-binding cassette, subfamily F, member 3 [Cryptococcus deuterogattii 2001/935-1]KNX50222.2 ATP-binding cassette subfamily F member 3 [Cryptococcus deuterogattii R265]